MKKIMVIALCLMLVFSLASCGNNSPESNANNADYENGYTVGYEEGYNAGHADGYSEGKEPIENNGTRYVKFSGSFTATVEELLPDYCALPGKTIAVVHFFQNGPFLLRFHEDMTDKLIEGNAYVFDFETFEIANSDDEYPSISDYMYSINVVDYRLAGENEMGLDSKMAEVEMIFK